MNKLKLFENYNEKDYIEEKLFYYNIINYDINDDMSVNVNGNVNLNEYTIFDIPVKFKKINGDFDISNNMLESLENSPEYLSGSFYCHDNKITSFEYSPKYIGENFDFSDNNILNFDFFPEYVGYVYNKYDGLNPIKEITDLIGQRKDIVDIIHEMNKIKAIVENKIFTYKIDVIFDEHDVKKVDWDFFSQNTNNYILI
jgi:hypothetical protein